MTMRTPCLPLAASEYPVGPPPSTLPSMVTTEELSAYRHNQLHRWSLSTRSVALYSALEQIGEGTYGVVYRGIRRLRSSDSANNEVVALKKIRMQFAGYWGIPATVLREIHILKKLQHKNMVRMLEVVSSKGSEGMDDADWEEGLAERLGGNATAAAAAGEGKNRHQNIGKLKLTATTTNILSSSKKIDSNSSTAVPLKSLSNDCQHQNNHCNDEQKPKKYANELPHVDSNNSLTLKQCTDCPPSQRGEEDSSAHDPKDLNASEATSIALDDTHPSFAMTTATTLHQNYIYNNTVLGNNSSKNKTGSGKKNKHKHVDEIDSLRESYKGSLFLCLEYVSHDLTGLLDMAYKFTEVQTKSLIHQLLEVLEYMHERKYVHRDLKSSNILITERFVLKLADFGLARCLDEGFIGRMTMGDGRDRDYSSNEGEFTNKVITLWYRPPELLLGETRYGTSVDIWSTGCIFAEIMLGRPIFTGKTEMEQLKLIFDLIGTPTENTWEGFNQLKLIRTGEVTIDNDATTNARRRPKLREKYSAKIQSVSALNLLEKLLELDPKKRITARGALSHRHFKVAPIAPSDPSELGIIDLGGNTSGYHEFQTKKRRREAKVVGKKAEEDAKKRGEDIEKQKEAFDKAYRDHLNRGAEGDKEEKIKRQNILEQQQQQQQQQKELDTQEKQEVNQTNRDFHSHNIELNPQQQQHHQRYQGHPQQQKNQQRPYIPQQRMIEERNQLHQPRSFVEDRHRYPPDNWQRQQVPFHPQHGLPRDYNHHKLRPPPNIPAVTDVLPQRGVVGMRMYDRHRESYDYKRLDYHHRVEGSIPSNHQDRVRSRDNHFEPNRIRDESHRKDDYQERSDRPHDPKNELPPAPGDEGMLQAPLLKEDDQKEHVISCQGDSDKRGTREMRESHESDGNPPPQLSQDTYGVNSSMVHGDDRTNNEGGFIDRKQRKDVEEYHLPSDSTAREEQSHTDRLDYSSLKRSLHDRHRHVHHEDERRHRRHQENDGKKEKTRDNNEDYHRRERSVNETSREDRRSHKHVSPGRHQTSYSDNRHSEKRQNGDVEASSQEVSFDMDTTKSELNDKRKDDPRSKNVNPERASNEKEAKESHSGRHRIERKRDEHSITPPYKWDSKESQTDRHRSGRKREESSMTDTEHGHNVERPSIERGNKESHSGRHRSERKREGYSWADKDQGSESKRSRHGEKYRSERNRYHDEDNSHKKNHHSDGNLRRLRVDDEERFRDESVRNIENLRVDRVQRNSQVSVNFVPPPERFREDRRRSSGDDQRHKRIDEDGRYIDRNDSRNTSDRHGSKIDDKFNGNLIAPPYYRERDRFGNPIGPWEGSYNKRPSSNRTFFCSERHGDGHSNEHKDKRDERR